MKAQGLSMSILVVASIAVIVLLVVGVFFSGGFKTVGTRMMEFIGATTDSGGSAKFAACSDWCTKNEIWNVSEDKTDEFVDRPDGCIC